MALGGGADPSSFEALLELAELLGQVKPPTASAGDIERSGLRVFAARELPALAAAGRVAASCEDRVSGGMCGARGGGR
jgi:hypothetical protein